ncbi:hypothetical protein McaMca56_007863 [Microsporum canis]
MTIITTSVGSFAIALLAFGRIVLGGPIPIDIRGDVIISIPSGSHTHTGSDPFTGSGALEMNKVSARVDNGGRIPPQWHLHNVPPPFTKHRNTVEARSTAFTETIKKIRAYIGANPTLEHTQSTAAKSAKPPAKRSEKDKVGHPVPTQSAVDHITPIPGGPWKYREPAKTKYPAKHRNPVPVICED